MKNTSEKPFLVFGERLADFQKESKLQTNDLAQWFEVDPNFIRMLIRGDRYPGKKLLRNFCEAFGEPEVFWIDILRWEREKDLVVKELLAEKIRLQWKLVWDDRFPRSQADHCYDPIDGKAHPIYKLSEIKILLDQIIQASRCASTENSSRHPINYPCFWLEVDDMQQMAACCSPGDLLLIDGLSRDMSAGPIKNLLALVIGNEDRPLIGKLTRIGEQLILDNKCGFSQPDRIEIKASEAIVFPIRSILKKS